MQFQLVIYDAAFNVGKGRIFTYDPNHARP